MLSILQSQFIEKVFKKTDNSEQNVVLLLFLFTLDDINFRFFVETVVILKAFCFNAQKF